MECTYHMKTNCYRLAIAIISLVGTVHETKALSIELELGPHGSYVERSYEFSALDGIALAGQSVSLDFSFVGREFLRVYSITDLSDFMVMLDFQTAAVGYPGFLGASSSGYVVGLGGEQYVGGVGRGMGDDGRTAIGLLPFTEEDGTEAHVKFDQPLDLYGAHFDIVFPELAGVKVVSSRFRIFGSREFVLLGNGDTLSYDAVFGVGPGIPRGHLGAIGT